MKELSIEQKARRYDEAIQRARQFMETPYLENSDDVVGFIFPELKESEDERIRKFLMREFYNPGAPDSYYRDSDITYNEIYNWLEKQGEDKVEPKFHVGDKVKRKDNPHLTYILKRLTDDGNYEFHAIGKDGHEGFTCFAGVKYQDDWELVEQKPQRIVSAEAKEAMYDKPAWSEEDEKMYQRVLSFAESEWGSDYDLVIWLKSLKPQNRWKPSDEQINALAKNVEYVNVGCTQHILKELLEDLKKLKE